MTPRACKVVGISGNIQRPSKSLALVAYTVETIEAHYGVKTQIFDVVDTMPELGVTLGRAGVADKVSEVLDAIENADVLVVGTPVYKGSYTGLFKHLFDLIAPTRLAGVPVVLTATGGGDRHALVVEHQLRPLFGFFTAHTIATAIYASEGDFVEGRLVSGPVKMRIGCAVRDLTPWLGRERSLQ